MLGGILAGPLSDVNSLGDPRRRHLVNGERVDALSLIVHRDEDIAQEAFLAVLRMD